MVVPPTRRREGFVAGVVVAAVVPKVHPLDHSVNQAINVGLIIGSSGSALERSDGLPRCGLESGQQLVDLWGNGLDKLRDPGSVLQADVELSLHNVRQLLVQLVQPNSRNHVEKRH